MGLWLGKRVSSPETLPEKQGFGEGVWLVAEELTKEMRSREKGESKEGTKTEKSGWGA